MMVQGEREGMVLTRQLAPVEFLTATHSDRRGGQDDASELEEEESSMDAATRAKGKREDSLVK